VQSAHELGQDKKDLKNKLSDIDEEMFEQKVFKLTPEEILEISEILEDLL
jgi:16S rRNA (adenine1518-N6/adenine1519-N6)-dimethyltransferase